MDRKKSTVKGVKCANGTCRSEVEVGSRGALWFLRSSRILWEGQPPTVANRECLSDWSKD